MVNIAKEGDCITSKDHLVDAMKRIDGKNGHLSCGNGEAELEDISVSLCELITQSLNMIVSVAGVLDGTIIGNVFNDYACTKCIQSLSVKPAIVDTMK